MTPQPAPVQTYANQYDAIIKAMTGYLDGVREGKSELMRPVFHPAATFFGHHPGGVMNGPIQPLFDWVDQNGPAPDVESRFATVQILGRLLMCNLNWKVCQGSLPGQEYRCPMFSH